MQSPRIQHAQRETHCCYPQFFPAQPSITITRQPSRLHSSTSLVLHIQLHLLRGCPVNPFPRIPTLIFFFFLTPNSFLNSLLLVLRRSPTLYPPSTFLRYFHNEKQPFCSPGYSLSMSPYRWLYNPTCSACWILFFLNTFYV